ncbi:MAG: Lrp/AsnC family transcriptional regulator [Candidatus Nanohaloarchaea archaeon]
MVDQLDLDILERLNEDGRASMRQVASEVDASPSTVSNRVKELRNSGVIAGFRPVIDYDRLGYNLTSITQIRTEAGMQDAVAEDLAERGFVTSLYQVTGDKDIIVIARFRGRRELKENLVQDLNKMDGVKNTNTNVVLESETENRPVSLEPLEAENLP